MVLGFAASAAASGAVGGRTKRARGVGVGVPDSDETDEESEEEEDEEDMDVDALAARVTIVFEGGRGGALPGYVLQLPCSFVLTSFMSFGVCENRFKYEPDALREAVLHLSLPSSDSSESPRERKRQRIDEEGREDAMDVEVEDPIKANTNGSLVPLRRGVELETAVERFLLRLCDAEAEPGAAGTDDIAAASEDVVDESADKQLLQGGANDQRRWEIWLLGPLDGDDDAEKVRNRPPGGDGTVLLQRGLRAENLEFVEGEVRVLQDATAAVDGDSETNSSAREGWAIEVRRWRWARW